MDVVFPELGSVLTNDEIHDTLGGSKTQGIRKNIKNKLYILITSSDPAKPNPYHDRWEGHIIHYTGMGSGDQDKFKGVHKDLTESRTNGYTVVLFEKLKTNSYLYRGKVLLNSDPYYEQQDGRRVCMFPFWVDYIEAAPSTTDGDKDYSWELLNSDVIIKKTDLSFFRYDESTIPRKFYKYFDAEQLPQGSSKEVRLLFNGEQHLARIQRESSYSKRIKILWLTDLGNIFKTRFPNFESISKDEYPSLRFEKKSTDCYEISFIDEQTIQNESEGGVNTCSIDLESEVYEGKRKAYYTYKYERDPRNRKAAIKIHGTKCMACGFDFEKTYGKRGRDFIEVHHIKPLYSKDQEMIVNPETDLITVCSNCHRMIHRKKEAVLTLEELKQLISHDSNRS